LVANSQLEPEPRAKNQEPSCPKWRTADKSPKIGLGQKL